MKMREKAQKAEEARLKAEAEATVEKLKSCQVRCHMMSLKDYSPKNMNSSMEWEPTTKM